MPGTVARTKPRGKGGKSKKGRTHPPLERPRIVEPVRPYTPSEVESRVSREFNQWMNDRIAQENEQAVMEKLSKKKADHLRKESEKKNMESILRLREETLKALETKLKIVTNDFIEVPDPKDKSKKIKVRYQKNWLRDPKKGNRYFFTQLFIRSVRWLTLPYAVLRSPWPKDRAPGRVLPNLLIPSQWKKKWQEQRKEIVGWTKKEVEDAIKQTKEKIEEDKKALAKLK